jgi:hydroxymethylbilane synthase
LFGVYLEMPEWSQLRIGSRKTPLALAQTEIVRTALKKHYPELEFPIITMTTLGDEITDIPLSNINEKGVFTKELELALDQNHVDIVVHSLKDLPTSLPNGMFLAAILKREDPRDVLVLHPRYQYPNSTVKDLASLPKNSAIGTGSLRRIAQLSSKYPHLIFKNIVSLFIF